MQRISQIKLKLDEPESAVKAYAASKAGIPLAQVKYFAIVGKAIDARDKRDIRRVYSVDISETNESRPRIQYPKIANAPSVVIAGFGPAGIFAALTLAKAGFHPIVVERGATVEKRAQAVERFWQTGELDTNTNVQFGEGGAGTFSDGKLTTNIRDPLCTEVLEEFVSAGAPKEILYLAKPHIGTDRLRRVVAALRQKLISLGGEVHFESPLTDFELKNGKIHSVTTPIGKIETERLILATGHSARDIYRLLQAKGLPISPKIFSVGVRIEHLQAQIDGAQYGVAAGHPNLPPADYKLAYHGVRNAYTFCMCPGGSVVASQSEANAIVTNGMSLYSRNGVNANAALLVNVTPDDFPEGALGGVAFQQKIEQLAFTAAGGTHKAPCQRAEDFMKNRPSEKFGMVLPTYRPGTTFCDLNRILPPYVNTTMKQALIDMNRKLRVFAHPDALLTGVETRSSAPVRVERNERSESPLAVGVYPCGEGCGYAGGIMSAAVDGIRVARAVIENFINRPLFPQKESH